MFNKGFVFKKYSTPLLKDFDIKTVLTSVKNHQYNTSVKWIHQVIVNMRIPKDLDKKGIDDIDPWGENLASISWAIRASYHRNIMATPGQAIFGIDRLFNLA